MARERRKSARFVIGGLMYEVNGVLHETLDISVNAVAVLHLTGVNYARIDEKSKFHSTKYASLNRLAANPHLIAQRARIVVIGYTVDGAEWEQLLRENDVRADMKQLEDVFG